MQNNHKIKKLKRAIVKEEFVALTGDITKAIILNQFIYWSERVQDFDKFIAEEQKRCQEDGTEMVMQLTNGWVYKTAKELSEETMLNLSASNIRNHLKEIIKNGWISERNNPIHKWDRTKQYRVNLIKISNDLLILGYTLQGYKVDIFSASNEVFDGFSESKTPSSVLENGTSKTENQTPDLENQISRTRQAIPEITTETTNRDYKPSIQPITNQDNTILGQDKNNNDGLSDGLDDNQFVNNLIEKQARQVVSPTTEQITSPNKEPTVNCPDSECPEQRELLGVKLIIQQICKDTGANAAQVRKAIQKANQMEKAGKVRSNYLKLVEAIAKTMVKEDLVKNMNNTADESDEKKELIKNLYAG